MKEKTLSGSPLVRRQTDTAIPLDELHTPASNEKVFFSLLIEALFTTRTSCLGLLCSAPEISDSYNFPMILTIAFRTYSYTRARF